MIDPTSITPGFLSASAAETLRETVEMTAINSQLLSVFSEPTEDNFPAKLTSRDSGTGYYAWTEQTFDNAGLRYDKPNGRTGDYAYSPAIQVGAGSPPSSYPIEVWLRRRVVFSGGVAYEFDWQGGSGTTTKMCRIVDPVVTFSSSFPNIVQAYTQKWAGPAATDYEDDEQIWLELL